MGRPFLMAQRVRKLRRRRGDRRARTALEAAPSCRKGKKHEMTPYSAAAFVYPYFSLSLPIRSAAAFGMFVPGPKIASAPAAYKAS